jgi:hypothetical protein
MRRSVVDYGLARRATFAAVLAGRTIVTDVCDAHPYLLRAAKFRGEPTDLTCQICRTGRSRYLAAGRGCPDEELLRNTKASPGQHILEAVSSLRGCALVDEPLPENPLILDHRHAPASVAVLSA